MGLSFQLPPCHYTKSCTLSKHRTVNMKPYILQDIGMTPSALQRGLNVSLHKPVPEYLIMSMGETIESRRVKLREMRKAKARSESNVRNMTITILQNRKYGTAFSPSALPFVFSSLCCLAHGTYFCYFSSLLLCLLASKCFL